MQKFILVFLLLLFILVAFLSWIPYFNENIVVPDILEIKKNDIRIYREFRKNYDKKILKDLSPKEIAKIYFYSIYISDIKTANEFNGMRLQYNPNLTEQKEIDLNNWKCIIESLELFDTIYINDIKAILKFRCIYYNNEIFSGFQMHRYSINEPWRMTYGWFYEASEAYVNADKSEKNKTH